MGAYYNGSFRNRMGKRRMNLSGSGYGKVAGSCECGNEPSGVIICGNFFTI
jgi:hypothetical protein